MFLRQMIHSQLCVFKLLFQSNHHLFEHNYGFKEFNQECIEEKHTGIIKGELR